MKKIIAINIFLLLTFIGKEHRAQNLEKVTAGEEAFKISGGLNYNSILYASSGMNQRRNPFTWFLSGNLNFNLLDWSIPVSYSYSNQHGTFTQPFNQYGISPSYKWVKIHAGYINQNYSSYSFAGHNLLGGAIELSPKSFRFSAYYGRLKKEIAYDYQNNYPEQLSYKRMGMGTKIGYEKGGNSIHIIYCYAKDDKKSIPFIPPNTKLDPEENVVTAITGKVSFLKQFFIEGEYAISGVTKNTSAEKEANFRNIHLPGLENKTSTQYFHAYKGGIGFTATVFGIQLNYEKVDPDYRTHGAYFFNNDIENITLAPSVKLFKNKLNLSANAGFQRNNLSKEKISTTHRWIGSVNLNYAYKTLWMVNGSYSNFSSYSRNRQQGDAFYQVSAADTLNFYQITNNASLNNNFNFEKKNFKHGIGLSGTYQVSNDAQSINNKNENKVLSVNAGYTLNFTKSKTTMVLSVNRNHSVNKQNETVFIGPGLSIGKSWYKNVLRLNLGCVYNESTTRTITNQNIGSISKRSIINNRMNFSFSPKVKNKKLGQPVLSMNMNYLIKPKTELYPIPVFEFTGMVNLRYTF